MSTAGTTYQHYTNFILGININSWTNSKQSRCTNHCYPKL